MKQDYYEVLGIGKQADEKEIKRAYRKLAKKSGGQGGRAEV